MGQLWALIDVNNFFVSCERIFRPDLEKKPVAVLSSNDGCIVSRSQEVKDLGIAMGTPKFQIEEQIKKEGIVCFSSNYRLYGDISTRAMATIRETVGEARQEVYSIDECFIRLTGMKERDWQDWARNWRARLRREIGLPVSVGVAQTKTLAKLAVEIAKKDFLGDGTMVWLSNDKSWQKQYFGQIPVTQVWGIGRASARKLLAARINTVEQLIAKDQAWIRQRFGLTGEKTWRELQGESCIELTEVLPSHRQILRSGSFGAPVTTLKELEQAIAGHLSVAVEQLRREKLRASMVSVMIRTSYFVEKQKAYSGVVTQGLAESTSYLPDLMRSAIKSLHQAYVPGKAYKKAGIILSGLEREEAWQPAMWLEDGSQIEDEKKQAVMKAMNQLNHDFGARKVGVGWAGMAQVDERAKWRRKSAWRSDEYSTNWEQLRRVK
ncbi:DUF4113 domain-containing protein [bacterium]|nr:DUF4113 domain-containing protein [bacterium]